VFASVLEFRARAKTRLRELLGTQRFDANYELGQALSFDTAPARAVDIATSTQSMR
jgi:hypothetical protein